MKWPMGNWNQMVNDEQIMKRNRNDDDCVMGVHEIVVFDSIRSCWCSSYYFKDPADCSFQFYLDFIYTADYFFYFLCQSSSLYRSNTQVIRPYNMFIHLLVCIKSKQKKEQTWTLKTIHIYILALGVNKVYTMRKKELKGVKWSWCTSWFKIQIFHL